MKDANALILDGIFYTASGTDILKGVHLKVPAGRVCGLFGRNGSGKTTVLKIASGQLRPSSGLTIIDGARFHSPSKRKRFAEIAYLPPTSMLPRGVTVRSLLPRVGLAPGDLPEPLKDRTTQKVQSLSTGERRLLEVEFVLNLNRRYLLLDEPFTGVEPILINHICRKVEEAAACGRGILLTDHYHQYAAPLVDVAYVMRQKECYKLTDDVPLGQRLEELGYVS